MIDVRLVQKLCLAVVIVFGLFAAYIGAYWVARKSDMGNEFFSSGEGLWQKAPEWLQRAKGKLFIPARDMEYWLGEYRQKRHLPGEWISKNGSERVVIDADMRITMWGFADIGFPDGSCDEPMWSHWGTARAFLVVLKMGNNHSMQVFVQEHDKNELLINTNGPRGRGGIPMARKSTNRPD
ncbi:hypothetical protein [Roseimicrobium sp. ORNL1]|uniref:hypothetical protein n=1 Tax=Roseimicrobium sp. ORNL1 TaxID=2711231 RepID=UPI0013E1DCFD|nr:hypothetical protein [Roseimicrobium sp. ORNL1]QIF00242.1 hypothetical protein G5S37_01450 [Roseimicrobium sp. ORNL1]